MPPNLSKDEIKETMKEALKEWLDGKFAAFGKYSLAGIMAAAFAGLLYLFVTTHGFRLK